MYQDNVETIYDQSFSTYRETASNRMSMPFTACKPKKGNTTFIIAEFHKNAQKLISDKTRLNLLKELERLSQDPYIKYDVRPGNSNDFLHSRRITFDDDRVSTLLIYQIQDGSLNAFIYVIGLAIVFTERAV